MKPLIQSKWLRFQLLIGAVIILLFSGAYIVQAKDTIPSPPKLPKSLKWEGRYIVKDLNVNVPFTWNGDGFNMQMIAGGNPADLIHFTNLIYQDRLYTMTSKWPDIEIPRPAPCSCVGRFTIDTLNACIGKARFVDEETLKKPAGSLEVNHFRVTSVPLMAADIYVDRGNSTQFWQVLHFGIQNLYDTAWDEWIEMQVFKPGPGEVNLPQECKKTDEELRKCDAQVIPPLVCG